MLSSLVGSFKRKTTPTDLLKGPGSMAELQRRWAGGVAFEREFWRDWLTTRGGRWPEDFLVRTAANHALDEEMARILRGQNLERRPRVLDVGAGPLSSLGVVFDNARIDLVPVDPLAPIYDMLLDQADVDPVARTRFAPAEALSAFFPASSFDFVHCQNALDHAINPFWGIVEMLRVTRVGGTVMLHHMCNEAEAEKHCGFHQWNFDLVDGAFVIWNRQAWLVVDENLPIACRVSHRSENNFIKTFITKLGEFDPLSAPDANAQRRWEKIILDVMQAA